MNLNRIKATAAAILLLSGSGNCLAITIAPTEDVMTSGFFTGTNLVRGYAGDGRPVHRVSTDGAFGVGGAETIYVTFDSAAITGISGPIASAFLTVESTDGGFGANADNANPFTVSAHAVASDPLASITDDTNPVGTISWLDYLNNEILPADPAAQTAVDDFGPVSFDVTSVVQDWIAGTNSVFALALTGENDASGADFLHGFANNSDAPGSTFLTVNVVPEAPTAVLALAGALVLLAVRHGCQFRDRLEPDPAEYQLSA